MRQLILGTAGHIDHGKSSFVRALTGVDPDRLKEEKERGITIELGFASLDLPDGTRIGIVDVPGHEKFVKNMVAGASGIDMVAMVIAADEGVMPQTREHMDICTLLGVRHGLVLLTKIDMVDAEMLELAKEDIADFTRGTFLEGAPLLPVSSVTGEGIAEFPEVVAAVAARIPERKPTDLLRLPIDRVFSMKGFGTVVTGTLVAGDVRVGDTVEIYPLGIRSKVRGLQSHNNVVDRAEAGMRTAINLQGLEKNKITKGMVVGKPGALIPSYMIDLYFHYLEGSGRPLKNRALVRVHVGTCEVLGNLVLLDREQLAPGEDAVVQLRLKEPVVCVKDDRVVVRSYSPVRTIGGGTVINPVPAKHKRNNRELVLAMERLAGCPAEDVVAFHCGQAGYAGVAFSALRVMTNLAAGELKRALARLLSDRTVVIVDREKGLYVHKKIFDRIAEQIEAILERFHEQNPLRKGMSRQEIKSRIAGKAGDKLFERVLDNLVKTGVIAREGDTVRLAGHKVALGSGQSETREKLLSLFEQSGLAPPYARDLPQLLQTEDKNGLRDVFNLLVQEGDLLRVGEDLYFHAKAIERLERDLVEFLRKEGRISMQQFKEMTGATRKYAVPLMEYFDTKKVTIRVGDVRRLRQ